MGDATVQWSPSNVSGEHSSHDSLDSHDLPAIDLSDEDLSHDHLTPTGSGHDPSGHDASDSAPAEIDHFGADDFAPAETDEAIASLDELPGDDDLDLPAGQGDFGGPAQFADADDEEITLERPALDEEPMTFSAASATAEENVAECKPSMLASAIMITVFMLTSIVAAGLVALPILIWGFKKDPLHVAKYLPASILPTELTKGSAPKQPFQPVQPPNLAQATNQPQDDQPFQTNVPGIQPKAPGDKSTDDAAADDALADDAAASDDMTALIKPAPARTPKANIGKTACRQRCGG